MSSRREKDPEKEAKRAAEKLEKEKQEEEE